MSPGLPDLISPAIRDLARTYEPERYIAATLAAAPARPALIVVSAFAADLRRIPLSVNEPMMGEIRLQWWRDSLKTLADGGRVAAPLADALGEVIGRCNVPIMPLVAMTEARAFDLYDDPIDDVVALDGYLGKTEAIPFELALRILGASAGDAAPVAALAGRAFGLTRMLATLPMHRARGRLPLPPALLSQGGLTSEMLLDGELSAAGKLVRFISSDIQATLATLRPQVAGLPAAQRAALLPISVVPTYLDVMARPGHNALRDIADLAPLRRVWRIALAHFGGRF